MKKKIPNCHICKWSVFPTLSQMTFCMAKCAAQGYKDTSKIYNNKLCKELYEPQEITNENEY